MKKKLLAVVLGLLLAPLVLAQEFTEEDGSPSVYPWQVKFNNGSLTDNADGTVSVDVTAGGAGAVTKIEDADADTKVDVEEGADDDTIRFDLGTSSGDALTMTEAAGFNWNASGVSTLDVNLGGDTIANLFHLDAGGDRININSDSTPVPFTINGGTFPSLVNIFGKDVVDHQNLTIQRSTDTAGRPARMLFLRSRGSVGSETASVAGDQLGRLRFAGHDGTDYEMAGIIGVTADGSAAVGNNDMPGSMQFFTTPDGSVTPTEKFRIRHSSVVVNEQGLDHDFRMETDVTSDAVTLDAGTGLFKVRQTADSGAFEVNADSILDLGNTNPIFFTHDTGASDVTASFTDPFVYIYTERRIDGTNTTTVADDYDNLHVSRHVVCDDCVGSSIDGAVIFANVVTEAGGANNTKILELDHDADSTGDVIQALHRGNGLVMDIDSLATTADVIDIVAGTTSGAVLDITANSTTTGNIIDITANGITAGAQLNFSSTSKDWSTGQFWKMNHTTTNNLTAKSINYIEAKADRTHNAASVLSDNYDLALFHRETDINNAGGTFNAAGSVVKIENRAFETAGTLADTVVALEIAQDDNSTGDAIEITHLGNGKSIEILADFATTTADVIDVSADTLTTGDALKLASTSNAVTTGFRMIDSQALGTAITADLGGAEAVNLFKVQRTNTAAAARTDNFDVMSIERNANNTNAGGSLTAAGSVLNLLNSVSQDAGTTTDSVELLTITQDSDSTGDSIKVTHNAATSGQVFEATGSQTTADVIRLNAGSLTTGNVIDIPILSSLTTGKGIEIDMSSNDLTSGEGLKIAHTLTAPGLGDRTGQMVFFDSRRGNSGAVVVTDDYDVLSVLRGDTVSNAGGTLNGSGSVFRVENQATQTAGTLNDSVNVIEVVQDADSTGDGINISMAGAAGQALDIDHDHATVTAISLDSETTTGTSTQLAVDALTTGRGFRVTSASANGGAWDLANFRITNAGADAADAVFIEHAADGRGIFIDHNGDGISIDIDSEATTADTINIDATPLTTGNAIDISSLNNLTTGRALNIYSGSNDASVRNLVNIYNDTGGDNTTVMFLRQDGDEVSLNIDQNGTGTAAQLDVNSDSKGVHILHDTSHAQATALDIENPDISEFDQASAIEIVYGTDVEVDATHAANVSFTDPLIYIQTYRNYDAGFNATDNYDMLHIDRQEELSGGTSTSAGSVAEFILDVQDSITTTADVLQLVNDAPNANNTGRSLFIDNDVVGNTVALIDAETTTGIILDIDAAELTTGEFLNVNPNKLTTGKGINFNTTSATALSSGVYWNIEADSGTPVTASKTGKFVNIELQRDHNDGTFAAADSFDLVRFLKTTNFNGGGGTTTSTGSVLRVINDVEASITDTTDAIQISMDSDSTGDGMDVDMNGASAKGIDIRGPGATGVALNIDFDSGTVTTGAVIRVTDTDGVDHTALEFQDEFILAIDAEANGSSGFRADGSTGGSIMLRDTDDAGWTECFALNGVLSCTIDADGVPDGA